MKQLILSICMGGLLFASGGCSRLLYGQWEVRQKFDPLDDSPSLSMTLPSENKGDPPLLLAVACEPGFTVVFIYGYSSTHNWPPWLGHLDDDITVWTRFDQRPAKKSRWIVEPNTRRSISPLSGILWATQIAQARKLFVRIIPESGRAVDATFWLKGAEKAMRPLREACGW